MKPIVTLTLNPTIDAASKAETVRPTRKVRTFDERYDPGGGGINVARVIFWNFVIAGLGYGITGVALTARDTGPLWVVYPRDRFGSALWNYE